MAQIVGECAERLNAGEDLDIAEVASRHPDLRPDLEEILRTLTLGDGRVVAADTGASEISRHLRVVGDYHVIAEVGRGGMGVVYEAWQWSLRRRVALKVLSPGLLGDERARRRFEREASWTARVDHPGICTIYDAGVDGDVHFIAMRFLEGETLRQRISARRREAAEQGPSPRGPGSPGHVEEVARLVEKTARALHVAHEAGIVHRDIKPSNIVVSEALEPTIVDFGLAGSEEVVRTELTVSGWLGTAAYMSPEQLSTTRSVVDRRSDIYSLGVTLYEALTLEPPFRASTRLAMCRQIVQGAPPGCRKRNSLVSRDLETVVRTAMETDPEHRYRTAEELADDLRRVLERRPIHASRPSVARRVRAWVSRYPVPSALLFLLLVATTVSVLLAVDARSRTREARRNEYAAQLATYSVAFRSGNYAEAARRLHACRESLRGWEWRHYDLQHDSSLLRFRAHSNIVRSLAYSPDGRRIVSGGDDRDDGAHDVRIWDSDRGELLLTLRGHRAPVWSVAWSPDGRTILSGSADGTVRRWDAASGALLSMPRREGSEVRAVVFAPDGRRFAAGDAEGRLSIWSGGASRPDAVFSGEEHAVLALTFHPSGSPLLSIHGAGVYRLWDPDREGTGRALPIGPQDQVTSATFSLDGAAVVTGHDFGQVETWSTRTGGSLGLRMGHRSAGVREVACRPGGRHVASAAEDRTLAIWDIATGERCATLPGHEKYVECVAYRPDGERIASGDGGGSIRIWDARSRGADSKLEIAFSTAVCFSPTGDTLACGGCRNDSGVVVLLDTTCGRVESLPVTDSGLVRSVAFSGDGRRIAAGASTREIPVRDTAGPGLVRCLRVDFHTVAAVALSHDGSLLAASDGKDVRVWDVDRGADVRRLRGHTRWVEAVLLTSDGRRVISGSRDRTVRVWDLGSGEGERTLDCRDWVFSLACSRDGRLLAAGDDNGGITLWETRGWRRLARPTGHDARVNGLTFHPDGSRLASAGDRTVRLWSTETGELISILVGHEAPVDSVAFDADGSRLASTGLHDPVIRIRESELSEARAMWGWLPLPDPPGRLALWTEDPEDPRLAAGEDSQRARVRVVSLSEGKVALEYPTGYLSARGGGGGAVYADRRDIGPRETWTLERLEQGGVLLRSTTGHYLTAERAPDDRGRWRPVRLNAMRTAEEVESDGPGWQRFRLDREEGTDRHVLKIVPCPPDATEARVVALP